MKVLCPIDFSLVSVKACYWIASLLNDMENSEIHLCHFIHFNRRASMFISVDDVFRERAEKDMDLLIRDLEINYPNVETKVSIYKAHPKEGIVQIAKSKDHDLIVTGTTGLNALKNLTIGSVTQYIFEHSPVPVLAIPDEATSSKLKKIALAVDDEMIRKITSFTFVRDLCMKLDTDLHIAHVRKEGDSSYEYDPGIDMVFKNLKSQFHSLEFETSIEETINSFCDEEKIDMLCIIHHKKNWLEKIFHKSVAKSELFKIDLPLLVLNEL